MFSFQIKKERVFRGLGELMGVEGLLTFYDHIMTLEDIISHLKSLKHFDFEGSSDVFRKYWF